MSKRFDTLRLLFSGLSWPPLTWRLAWRGGKEDAHKELETFTAAEEQDCRKVLYIIWGKFINYIQELQTKASSSAGSSQVLLSIASHWHWRGGSHLASWVTTAQLLCVHLYIGKLGPRYDQHSDPISIKIS